MRHVPGFDQGWRGYKRQDKDSAPLTLALSQRERGKDTGSSINNVEDDRQKTKNKHSAMRHVPGFDQGWRGYERQDKDAGFPIKNVGDKRRG